MIYLNGSLVSEDEAHIAPNDRGLLLGDGVFETMRAEQGRVLFPDAHLKRLSQSAAVIGISIPESFKTLSQALVATLDANHLNTKTVALRMTITRGPGQRGLLPPKEPKPTILITAVEIPEAPSSPARACLASLRRNEHSPLSGIKSLNYLENILARQEAFDQGVDEALFLNTSGRLAGGCSTNLFLVVEGTILTPPIQEGALPGIIRRAILDASSVSGIPSQERPLSLTDLDSADEAFLTNSLIGVWPLVAFDGAHIGNGEPGPITLALQAACRSLG